MGHKGHKFHGDVSRLDNPRRHEVMPPDKMITALGEIDRCANIADLGAAIGFLTVPLAKHFGDCGTVYAVDINAEFLAKLRERAAGLDNIKIVKSEENSIPIENATIDASFIVALFHELDDPKAFVAEIKRISKPNHKIVVVDFNQVEGEMGPPLSERVPEGEVIDFFVSQGYRFKAGFEPSAFVYGLVFEQEG